MCVCVYFYISMHKHTYIQKDMIHSIYYMVYIYPKKLQFAAYGQFVLVFIKKK